MKNELILFETADKEIKLNVSVKDSTVWLNRNQFKCISFSIIREYMFCSFLNPAFYQLFQVFFFAIIL